MLQNLCAWQNTDRYKQMSNNRQSMMGQDLAIITNNNNYLVQSKCVRHVKNEKQWEPNGKASALYTTEIQVHITGPMT